MSQAYPVSYSSISRRIGAMLIDALILLFPAFVLGHAIPVVGQLLVGFLYAPILESSEIKATIGKQLMGIQVTDLGGRRISFRAAVIRYFMKVISSLFLFLGHFMAIFTERHQALHDIVAETVVVYGRSEKPMIDAWIQQVKALLGSEFPSAASGSGSAAGGALSELERLQALREKGALTEEEFERQKKRVLGEG